MPDPSPSASKARRMKQTCGQVAGRRALVALAAGLALAAPLVGCKPREARFVAAPSVTAGDWSQADLDRLAPA
jgi:hypothetical protein